MGIVNQHSVLCPRQGDHLHTALHMMALAQRCSTVFQRDTQCQRRSQNIQSIIYHKSARNTNKNCLALRFCHRIKGNARRTQRHVFRPQIRRSLFSIGQHLTRRMFQQAFVPGIVPVDDTHATHGKEPGFGVAVGFHRFVKVQVILGQIGENAYLKGDAIHPVRDSAWEDTSITT